MPRFLTFFIAFVSLASVADAASWWKPEWTLRKKITVDTTSRGSAITEPVGGGAVLVRLHEGNFQFLTAKEDGSDIRFVAEDDKTPLVHHIEKYDSLLNEAYVWVKVPEVKPGAQTSFWLYYGNQGDAPREEDVKGTYDAETTLVYHFAENTGSPVDSSPAGQQAEGSAVPLGGALIGGGLRLTGQSVITMAAASSLEWSSGSSLTWSAWIKPLALQPDAVLFSRRDGAGAFIIGENNGVPYVEISGAGGTQRSAPGEPLAVNVWRHLAIVSSGGTTTLYLDGKSYTTLAVGVPDLKGPALLGKDSTGSQNGFTGEIDELQISKVARPTGLLQFAAINQGTGAEAGKLLVTGEDEVSGGGGGHSEMLEHVMLFGDIAKNMMFDGWIAIGVCVLMINAGWGVAIRKFTYLNSIQKGSEAFIKLWNQISSDLTVLDHDDPESVKTLGGSVDKKTLTNLKRSPIYHLYHIGSDEIRHRLGAGKDKSKGLSARSIQAIRAALESGLVRENQRMNKGLIFLTISIAGGPYVGLLGTVVGVMITFAIIAKSGEVDVNSIAPGIASALLATVAGLVVAIPALFIYSYLSSRIKDLIASMQVFNDEFVAKMAEFYPTPGDTGGSGTASGH
ncbi:MAG: DUF2341 domain-containing protein [Verrucomicrobiota bacterium]